MWYFHQNVYPFSLTTPNDHNPNFSAQVGVSQWLGSADYQGSNAHIDGSSVHDVVSQHASPIDLESRHGQLVAPQDVQPTEEIEPSTRVAEPVQQQLPSFGIDTNPEDRENLCGSS